MAKKLRVKEVKELVLVEWIDAESRETWSDMVDVNLWAKEKPFVCREVGWVIEDNKSVLVLTSQLGDENLVGNRTKIPKPWVIKKVVLKQE